jgi:hypothetical protein
MIIHILYFLYVITFLKSNIILNCFFDIIKAFLKAWDNACGTTEGTPTLTIPEGKTFMLQPLLFHGPCKPTTITIEVLVINDLLKYAHV